MAWIKDNKFNLKQMKTQQKHHQMRDRKYVATALTDLRPKISSKSNFHYTEPPD